MQFCHPEHRKVPALIEPEPMRRIPTARIGSGCSIGAGPLYRKETIINSNRSRQFLRPGPSVLPSLAVGIPRDADRPAMAVLFSSFGMTAKGLISKKQVLYGKKR